MTSTFTDQTECPILAHNTVRQLLHSIEALVITLDTDGVIHDCNSTCEVTSGFSLQELEGRSFANTFAVLKEADLLQRKIEKLASTGSLDRFEAYLLSKLGAPKRIRWSGVRLEGENSSDRILMLSGIDITREHEAVKEMTRTKQTAEALKHKLIRLSSKYGSDDELDVDRRADTRRFYPRGQRAAPVLGAALPTESDFVRVECRNISARGIGFVLEAPPSAPTYVVELGDGPHAIYLTADVKHATADSSAKQARYLVGCAFTGRITAESLA